MAADETALGHRISTDGLAGMTAMAFNVAMTAQAIRNYMDAAPFTPVNLITSSGQSFLVPHPDFLTLSPTGRTCNVYAEDGEYFTTLDLARVMVVVPVKPAPAKKKKQ